MIKKILVLTFHIIYTFTAFALEAKPVNVDILTEDEKNQIKTSIIYTKLSKNINADWYQEKIYQNNDISVSFAVVFNENGTIQNLKMNNVYCGNDSNNECEHFVLNTKKNLFKAFPMKDLFSSIHYKYWRNLNLCFGSKEGNECFLKQQTKK